MIIVWNTMDDTGNATILYGANDSLSLQATGDRFEFVSSLGWPQTQNTVSYVVGSNVYGWSDQFKFRTWPDGENWSRVLQSLVTWAMTMLSLYPDCKLKP
ncbi:unnamed protein product [Lymnaea stagnalis]|uniref:Uncharacterized protein n=1 Tax=Lymnaea stagnalis TaxID=6523 RepID=A0AAV2HBQ9_LYMST